MNQLQRGLLAVNFAQRQAANPLIVKKDRDAIFIAQVSHELMELRNGRMPRFEMHHSPDGVRFLVELGEDRWECSDLEENKGRDVFRLLTFLCGCELREFWE